MIKKVTPVEKMSKKKQREFFNKQRQTNGFNTGTRDMGKIKREKFDEIFQKEIDNYL